MIFVLFIMNDRPIGKSAALKSMQSSKPSILELTDSSPDL